MFTCSVPCDLAALSKVVSIDRDVFGKRTLSLLTSTTLFSKRPDIYAAIFAPNGSVAGYLDLYPLQEASAERFIEGEISEQELTPDMILNRSESHEGCCYYAGSIVVDSRYDPIMKSIMIASLFKWHAHQMALHVKQQARIVMTLATSRGARLVQKLKVTKLRDGKQRKDGLDIFGRLVTSAEISNLHNAFSKLEVRNVVNLKF